MVVVAGGSLGALLLPHARTMLRSMVWNLHDDCAMVPISLASCADSGVLGAAALGFRQGALVAGPARAFSLRRAQVRDLPELYHVCLGTGDAGADGTHLFSDPVLLGSIYVGPYVTLSPLFAYALVEDDRVCGYTLGVLDTRVFYTECETKWWPALRETYPKASWNKYRPNERELIEQTIFGGFRSPLRDEQLDMYPSHLHIDLLPPAQGRGWGPVMVGRLLDALRGAGSVGVHLTMMASNARAFNFYLKLGFQTLVQGETEWVLGLRL